MMMMCWNCEMMEKISIQFRRLDYFSNVCACTRLTRVQLYKTKYVLRIAVTRSNPVPDIILSPKLRRKFNCLHAQMYMIRKRAEANCRKVSNGQVPWSPRIQAMWDKMHLLRLLLKTRKKCKVSSRKIRRLISKTKLHGIWRKSTAVLRLLLKEERSLYKVAKKDHATLWRQQHVEGLLNKARRRKHASKKEMERFLRRRVCAAWLCSKAP